MVSYEIKQRPCRLPSAYMAVLVISLGGSTGKVEFQVADEDFAQLSVMNVGFMPEVHPSAQKRREDRHGDHHSS